ncbi:MAG: hydroxyacid dehydrogenase [Clostridia bacterium]|nr:hydroxyacid dehydrogenase [Clostridia bacterium]
MKIAVLANSVRTGQVFTDGQLAEIGRMGELLRNDEPEGPGLEKAAMLIKDAAIAVTSWDCPVLDEAVLKEAPGLKLVFHAAGSVKGIVSEAIWDRGIRVSSAASALGRGVAETALGLTITSLKNVWNLSKVTGYGGWNGCNDTVRELYGINIGIIGAGHAGRHFIRLLKNFDAGILLYDPTLDDGQCAALGAKKTGLEELLADSDVVSIHAPSVPATYHMLNSSNLGLMKDRAILINTARGSLIDETALITELKKGRISACIDVTDPEPPDISSELRQLPNVILTPHISGSVNNGKKRIGRLAVDEISSFLACGKLGFEIKREDLPTLA